MDESPIWVLGAHYYVLYMHMGMLCCMLFHFLRLGTGSVKQVNRARWVHADGTSEDVAVAVLRSNVEDEALSSIDALGKSPEVCSY